MKRFFVFFLSTFLLASQGFATGMSSVEEKELRETATEFSSAWKTKHYMTILPMALPRLIPHMAEVTGTTENRFKMMMVGQMQQAFSQAEFETIEYDFENIISGRSTEGRLYAVIPTTSILNTSGVRAQNTGSTLAVAEDGHWYLMQVEHAGHIILLKELYPDLAGLQFPPSSSQILKDADGETEQ